jgi:hypothetical protein
MKQAASNEKKHRRSVVPNTPVGEKTKSYSKKLYPKGSLTLEEFQQWLQTALAWSAEDANPRFLNKYCGFKKYKGADDEENSEERHKRQQLKEMMMKVMALHGKDSRRPSQMSSKILMHSNQVVQVNSFCQAPVLFYGSAFLLF